MFILIFNKNKGGRFMALVFMFIFAFGTLLFYHIFLWLFNKKELKKEKERKNFLLNNIRYKISHKNGLIENYCDENNFLYFKWKNYY